MQLTEDDFVLVTRDDTDHLAEVAQAVDEAADGLWTVNKTIHDNPELGYHEYKAHNVLTEYMQQQQGWVVAKSAYSLATAWTAVYDSGRQGPVVSFNAEYGS